ncbi:alanine:cation symporter family protein [Corynebacterium incognita]|uniref:Alanine:cation symporter family protein n=1 Tax=Corynebacterium incognita TaxID=2754725 RepID=A0A7G7CPG4_9CORY|nr:alanine/glycine:cation symporter family protein [Corynebacterium incognita]QNE89480.1 alanine:cation symporter family protein [Corynebacterium incognita]
MEAAINTINGLVWSPALVLLCLVGGLYFTFATKFLQIRHLGDMTKLLVAGEKSESGVSSFQSLMMSLAGRVGTGNIAGVATAIAFGGPGAVFWMWVMAFFGSATSFVECTLAQIYKEQDRDSGEYRGGPAYYIEKAYKHTKFAPLMTIFAIVFALTIIPSTSYFMAGVQANGIASAMNNAWGTNTAIVGIGIAAVLAVIIIGGVKRIATFASLVVPAMATVYIITALVILAINYQDIPHVFGLIFRSAFNLESGFGGMIGSAIMWGVKRGIFSNEAGQGFGPQHAAAAEVSHPAKQGFVQAFAVYIDTLFVCSATAFIIISTDMYKVFEGESEEGAVRYAGSLPDGIEAGPGYVQAGLDSVTAGIGPSFVAVALAFFAFTTILSYYYMSETNVTYLGRFIHNATARRVLTWALRIMILIAVYVGAGATGAEAWALGDIGAGSVAWLNMVAILILQVPALKALKDYREQKAAGKDPDFNPPPLGIRNADFWEERHQARIEQGIAPGEVVNPLNTASSP